MLLTAVPSRKSLPDSDLRRPFRRPESRAPADLAQGQLVPFRRKRAATPAESARCSPRR